MTIRPVTRYVRPSFDGDSRAKMVNFDPSNPEASGLTLMNEQRAKRWSSDWHGGHGQHFAVGGFCQHTILDRNGVSMKVLERWPDRVGERISPPIRPVAAGTFGRL